MDKEIHVDPTKEIKLEKNEDIAVTRRDWRTRIRDYIRDKIDVVDENTLKNIEREFKTLYSENKQTEQEKVVDVNDDNTKNVKQEKEDIASPKDWRTRIRDFINNEIGVVQVSDANTSTKYEGQESFTANSDNDESFFVKAEMVETELAEISFNRDRDDNSGVKVDIDIDEMVREKTSYKCKKCGFESLLHCTYQVHVDGCLKQPESSETRKSKRTNPNANKRAVKTTDRSKCEICEKTFSSKSKLAIHLKTHLVDKKYECKVCEKVFNHKQNLHTHVKAIHEKVEYECDVCDKTFSNKQNLNTHVKAVHSKVKFDCDICHKTFQYKHTLDDHVKINHSENKVVEFECEVCKKSFKQKRYLDKHMKAVHDKTKFECEICSKIFNCKEYLNKHLLAVHDENRRRNK